MSTFESAEASSPPPPTTVLGWREWVGLPDWGVVHVKAKVDTGARTSALHAHDLAPFTRDDAAWVRFSIHPFQASDRDAVEVEAPVIEEREVRSSNGEVDLRPVVVTDVVLGGRTRSVEVTLTQRDAMGFRMLVGREAMRGAFLVDPAKSYLGGRPRRPKRRRTR